MLNSMIAEKNTPCIITSTTSPVGTQSISHHYPIKIKGTNGFVGIYLYAYESIYCKHAYISNLLLVKMYLSVMAYVPAMNATLHQYYSTHYNTAIIRILKVC